MAYFTPVARGVAAPQFEVVILRAKEDMANCVSERPDTRSDFGPCNVFSFHIFVKYFCPLVHTRCIKSVDLLEATVSCRHVPCPGAFYL